VLHELDRKREAYDRLRAIQSDAAAEEEVRRDAYLLEAALYQKDGETAAEMDAYARGLAAFPDEPEILYARALSYERQDDIPRAEAVRRLRYLKPATSFRSGYAYDNVLYMVAGQLIEAVTGQTWEDYVREHVFAVAGMTTSTTDGRRFGVANRAQPHARMNGGLRGAGDQEVLDERDELATSAAPAGGLAVSANDMAKWLKLQLAHGALPDGKRLFSAAQGQAMWQPTVIQPLDSVPPGMEATKPTFQAYALGWEVQDYRGTQIVWHGGAVFGFKTAVVLIPDRNAGFSIELNSEDGELVRGLMYELLDHYLGLKPEPWTERYIAYKKQLVGGALKALGGAHAKPAGVGPSLTRPSTQGFTAIPGMATSRSPRPAEPSTSTSSRPRAWPASSSTGSTTPSSLGSTTGRWSPPM